MWEERAYENVPVHKLSHYRFESVWRVNASSEEVFDALCELRDYPEWWPEVKESKELGPDRYELRCRSFLPYDLRFVTTRAKSNRDAGVLEARLHGDLNGFSRWTIVGDGPSSSLRFEEEVRVGKKLLNVLAPIARPAFIANHTVMMRHGETGLRAYLAGLRLGRRISGSPARS